MVQIGDRTWLDIHVYALPVRSECRGHPKEWVKINDQPPVHSEWSGMVTNAAWVR